MKLEKNESKSMKTNHVLSAMFALAIFSAPFLVRAADPAPAKFESMDEEAIPLKFVIVENGKPVEGYPKLDGQAAAYRKTNEVPSDHKLRIGVRHYYQDGVGFHDMIAVIVPLNAAGQPNGLESTYKEHIGLIHTTMYKDGLKDGKEIEIAGAYQTAYTRVETPWAAGKIHGVRKMFHPNKKILAETPFENGVENGESKSYDVDGNLIRTVTFKAGRREGNMTDFWPGTTKPKRVVPYKSGKIEGVVRDFYLEGTLKAEIPFKSDRQHGIAKELQPDGKPIKTVYWIEGEQMPQAEFEKKFKN